MKFITSRQLDRFPTDIASNSDKVVVLTVRDKSTFLDTFDSRLAHVWSKPMANAVALLRVDQKLWILDSEGAWACGDFGQCLARVRVTPREGMQLAAFCLVDDGFIFAWQHDVRARLCPPVLERVNFDGKVHWSVTLPIGSIAYEGVVQMSADENWKPRPMDPWTPDTWFSTSRTLLVSGDAVLACFNDMPSSGIGCGYVVSSTDGALRFTTKNGPISEAAAFGGGAFLVGYQGYGAFETLQYDRNGRVLELWASHGYYLVGDGIRVIELENTLKSRMHIVRLHPGGIVEEGKWLDGYYTSRPFLGTDETAYFFRKGAVVAARDLSIDEQLVLTTPNDKLYSTAIVGDEKGFFLAYSGVAGNGGANLVRIDV